MLIIAKLKLEGNAKKLYEASLQNDKELTYEKFKEAMTSHFKETPPFETEFANFSSAVQFENVKDFSIRVQGLSQKCLESVSENEKVSKGFKEKLLFSKFISGLKANIRAGLKANIRAQVLIANPSSFAEAVDFALRVKRSFEVTSPNVNVISQADSNTVEGVKVSNEINRKSVSKVRIPPNSQRYVDISIEPTNVTLQVGQPLLIEKYVNSHSSSFLVARAVLNMNTNNRCLALILNLNDSTLELSDLGECSIIQYEIHLTDNIPTINYMELGMAFVKSEIKKQINILLDAGIIQPSTSSYAAPVLLVKKSDGSFRLVADLRKLNSKTIPDNFPLPNLSEMIDMLSGSKFFSTLDLTSGFHQMQMNPSHAHLTGIITEFGLFQYKRLPFGLKNAGASFQRLMSIVLAGLSDLKIACYIDDIIIASKTFEEHMNRLEIVFKRLQSANLKVKPSKCFFLQHEITYLGHTVREGQVLPDGKNLDSIRKSLPPTNRKQVRSFLGLMGFL
ncbi:retrovirus-related Pol polyprotein from transposon 17.6 [Caerostris darwini]|uniref:Retrovirus-related Pol polyprotein from transposon 17.6 n=1 Tax=Caerostris darwini TaxID=1538125 RepID=A0AAV4TGA8_9ARAC|nr:retrovirus-related Pol polyprotein from transposon 17.6 [Caerostris darwini]